MKRATPWLLFLILIPLAWPHLFLKGQVPVDGNSLRLFYPNWAFLHAHPVMPWKWPLWNPCRNMGEPFLADPQSLAAYPPMWMLCRFSSYLNVYRCWIAGHTLLAAYFMGQWMRHHQKDSASALAAAAVAVFNGYFMAHGTLMTHFASLAYVPMVFYFFDLDHLFGFGMALAMQWLAGFPPFSLLTGIVLIAWSILSASSKRRLLFQGAGLAAGLAAFQIIPFMELFFHSSRPVFLDLTHAISFSEPWRQLLRMLFIPHWAAWEPQLIGDQAVVSFYVGPVVCLLAGGVLWNGRRRERLVFLGVAGSFLLSLGAYLPGYQRIPWLRIFRFPANWLMIAWIGLAWLSGIGISLLPRKRQRWLGTAFIIADLLVFAQYVRVPWFPPAYLEQPPLLAQTLIDTSRSFRLYHSPTIMQALDQQMISEAEEYRFLKAFLPPSYGMAFGLREAQSYQVLRLTRAERYQRRMSAEGPASPLVRWAGIGTLITRKPGQGPLGPDTLRVVAMSHPELPLFFSEGPKTDKVDVQESDAGIMKANVYAPQGGILVFSEVDYPSWHVLIDGKRAPVLRFEDTFIGVRVPVGKHEVIFQFMSPSFLTGLVLSSLTASFCCLSYRNRWI